MAPDRMEMRMPGIFETATPGAAFARRVGLVAAIYNSEDIFEGA